MTTELEGASGPPLQEELEAHWSAEAKSTKRNPYYGRRLLSVPGIEAYAGLDQSGSRRFVAIRMDRMHRRSAATRFPRSSRGVIVESVDQGTGGIAIFLREQAGIPPSLFPKVIADVLSASDRAAGDEAIRLILDRFSAWQVAMSRQASDLTDLEARGILGELLVVRDVIEPTLGMSALLDVWRSPDDDHVHDFVGTGWELEVKTALLPAMRFHVSTDGQLEAGNGSRMFLYVLELEPDSNGISLEDATAALLASCNPSSDLHESIRNALIRRGAVGQAQGAESEQKYRLRRMDLHEVTEGFPFLPRKMLPRGVGGLRYEVDLGACGPFRIEPRVLSDVLTNRSKVP